MLQSLHKVRTESQNLANVFTGSISVSFFCEKDRLRKKCSQICEHLVSLQIVLYLDGTNFIMPENLPTFQLLSGLMIHKEASITKNTLLKKVF